MIYDRDIQRKRVTKGVRPGNRKPRFWDTPFRSLWRLAANLLLIVVVCFVFVFVLNKTSERSGSIVHVVERAKSPLFLERVKDNLRVMRLPLGAPVSYDLVWFYLEGGCQTEVHLDYEEVTEEPTTISLKIKGRNLPVGGPGPDHIERKQPPGITPGLWKYTSTLTAVCANGRKPPPETMVEFYLEIYDPQQPAFARLSDVKVLTPTVHAQEKLRWRYDVSRVLDGDATVIFTFVAKDAGTSGPGKEDIIVVQRPAVFNKVGVYKDTDFSFDLPAGIRPGEWSLQVNTVTNLPNKRTQVDVLATFNFEVLS